MSPTTSISPEKSVRLIGGKDICVGRRCRESSPVVYFGSDQQVGEGFVKELDFGRVWLRLNENDEGEKDDIIAEWKDDAKAFLMSTLVRP